MRTHPIGDRDVTVIGLGTADYGGKISESQAREFMDGYLAVGGNFIDTARVYGDFKTPRDGESEKIIGRWMSERHCRDSVFLSTKGGHPHLAGLRVPRLSREEVRADMAASLEDLQTDHVDIYWLHRDDRRRPVRDILETLQSLIDDGSARLVGVSNWKADRIAEANECAAAHGLTPLFADQPQFSLARSRMFGDPTLVTMTRPLWEYHKKTGMVCVCFSSQAGGYFAKRANPDAKLSFGAQAQYRSRANDETFRRLTAMSAETGMSVSALCMAWLTCQPFPTFALAGASRMAHIEAMAESGSAALTDAQRDSLRDVSRE